MFIGLFSLCTIGGFGQSIVSNSKGTIKCLTMSS